MAALLYNMHKRIIGAFIKNVLKGYKLHGQINIYLYINSFLKNGTGY